MAGTLDIKFVQEWESAYEQYNFELKAILPTRFDLLQSSMLLFLQVNGNVLPILIHEFATGLGNKTERELKIAKKMFNFVNLEEALYAIFFYWVLFEDAKRFSVGRSFVIDEAINRKFSLNQSLLDLKTLLMFWEKAAPLIFESQLFEEQRNWSYNKLTPYVLLRCQKTIELDGTLLRIDMAKRAAVIDFLLQSKARSIETAVTQISIMEELKERGHTDGKFLRDIFKDGRGKMAPEWDTVILRTESHKVYLSSDAIIQ